MNTEKYSWQKVEENKFYVWHIEGDTKTLIAITDNAEKADYLSKASNYFSKNNYGVSVATPEAEILKEIDEYLSQTMYYNGKPIQLNSMGAGSILHQKVKAAIKKDEPDLVAKDDYEPSKIQSPDEASLASHTCTSSNSIQHIQTILFDVKELIGRHYYASCNDSDYPMEFDREEINVAIKKLASLLNNHQQ